MAGERINRTHGYASTPYATLRFVAAVIVVIYWLPLAQLLALDVSCFIARAGGAHRRGKRPRRRVPYRRDEGRQSDAHPSRDTRATLVLVAVFKLIALLTSATVVVSEVVGPQ